jgi:type I restriction enzyme, S subunit
LSEHDGLPVGWAVTSLGAIGDYLNGRAFSKSEWSDVGRPIIRIQDLTGTGSAPNYYSGEDLEERYRVRTGDLLVSWSATLGAFVWNGPQGWLNQHIFKVVSFVDRRFHYFLIRTILNELYKQTHGSGMVHITKGKFEAISVALPPLLEQRRIVQAIEEQLSRLDAGVAALERVRTNLKRYRAATLKAAVEGRLTENWREENPDVETASELLDRILKERRERWERDQPAAYEKKGKKPPKNWRSKYREPAGPNTEELPELPAGWCWASLPQIGWFDRGRSRHRPRNAPHLYGGPYPFIQTSDVRHAEAFIRDYKQTYSEAGLQQSKLWPAGTLCIIIAANIAETGILSFDACFPDSVVGFLASPKHISTRFVDIYLRTIRDRLEAYAPATAQKNINIETLKQVAIVLPPMAEQEQIIAEVERRLSILQEVEAEVEANLKRAARLRQAILKRAFEGKLVPQDPTDEPASKLLARIRIERERSGPAKRRKKIPARDETAEAQAGLF